MAVTDGDANGTSNTTTQAQLDLFETPLTIPLSKLDADQYSAEDLDGVTESIFSSGNMAHATLQASQTDAGILLDGSNFSQGDIGEVAIASADSGDTVGSALFDRSGTDQQAGANAPQFADQGRIADDKGGISVSDSGSGGGSFASGTVGSLGASTLSSDVGGFSPSSNLGLNNNNLDTNSSADTTITNSVTNNRSEMTTNNNVNNITNNNIDDTIQKLITTINETVEHITELGDEIITNVLEGDIFENIEVLLTEINDLTQNLSSTVNNVTDIVNNLYENTILSEVVNNVTNVTNELTETIITNVDNILGGLTIDFAGDVLDTLGTDLNLTIDKGVIGELSTDVVAENVFSLVNELTGLDTALIDNTALGVGFELLSGQDVEDGNDITIQGITTPDLDLNIIEDIVGDIDINLALPIDLAEPAALGEALETSLNSLGDLDLAAPGEIIETLADEGLDGALGVFLADEALLSEAFDIEVQDILDQAQGLVDDILEEGGLENVIEGVVESGLDEIVEGITGDSGLEEIVEGITGDSGLEEIVEGITGDSGLEEIVEGITGDSGLEEIVESLTEDSGLEEIVESITEDSGLEEIVEGIAEEGSLEDVLAEAQDILDEAEEQLGELIEGIIFGSESEDNPDSDGEEESWTESVVNGEGLFDDILEGAGGDEDGLPDPIGSIAEGIGALDVEPDLDLGGLGGLFG